jgi:hypothetical protein
MAKTTTAQLREQTKAIIASIERQKAASQRSKEQFAAMAPADLEKKVSAKQVPSLGMFSWSKVTAPGGQVEVSVFVLNPESNPAPNLYVHVWVGSGNIDPVVGTFLSNVDTRFPRLTRPENPGLVEGDPHPFPLSPGLKRLNFFLAVPPDIEESVYLGNICVMQLNGHGVGKYLDRGVFQFSVRRPA